ncbi:MAG: YbaB/EbfC family nucleoid-associated protein [Candidatus Kapabacteria bacterium]|nr:YbaB/EbfC family nucleoid-associated protein [Candidatus Kapabacteria bacterium]
MKFDIQSIMQQAQKMQEEVERIKKGLENITMKSDSGGGMVVVEITASGKILNISIAPELIKNDDISMLEDLVVAAVNKAQENASRVAEEEMKKVRGMLPNIPGMNLGF